MSAQPQYAVIGNPVEHSLSPQFFTWLFSELGIRADYSRELVLPDDLPDVIARLHRGDWNGISVTLPHKETICGMLDELDSSGLRVGACNTVVRLSSGRLRGFNTDGAGLRLALEHAEGADLRGAQVILLGAGGAARAAAFEVASGGARELTIANRTFERAQRLAADLVKAGAACAVRAIPLEDEPISKALANAGIVINCTSVGLLAPGQSPLPSACRVRAGQTVLDMVYRPLQTSLLKRAAAQGAKTVDGLWMLIFQALEQLRLWTERQCSAEVAQKAHRYLTRQIA
jgi:shikimate dehydrogenase